MFISCIRYYAKIQLTSKNAVMVNYRTQKILLTGNIDDETEAYLLWCCHQANSLYNSALFAVRQAHFEQCPERQFFDRNDQYRTTFKDRYVAASYSELCKDFRLNKHYIGLGGQQGQQCLKSVVEAIESYNKLLKAYWEGEIDYKPRIPGYRTSDGLYQVTFPSQAVNYDECVSTCNLAISREGKPELVNKELVIPGGSRFTSEQLSEVRIVPTCGKLWAEYVYQVHSQAAKDLDYKQAIGIDPGVTNLLSVVSTKGRSFIVCGRQIKFFNQKYNKAVARYKKGKSERTTRGGEPAEGGATVRSAGTEFPQAARPSSPPASSFYWDEYLDQITHQRNCQVRDALNKAARFITNYCLKHKIGNIVFGWGQGVKMAVKLGKQNNQNFVAIPLARLKNRIKELAESTGIKFHETEEAYTSKSDYLAGDLLFKFGEKPKKYKFSGIRVARGTYKSKFGCISADVMGAVNILKKVAIQLGISLSEVGRAVLTLPKRYNLSHMRRSYRKRVETCLQTVS